MGYVKDRIKELSKMAGSKSRARKDAESWFSGASVSEAKSTRSRFEPGKIYVFDYTPGTPGLEWWDMRPVVLAIETVGDNDLGVNLNLLPTTVKEDLLDELYTRQKRSIERSIKQTANSANQKPLRITYEGMKNYLKSTGCDFAIRQYTPSRKKGQQVVSYARWAEISLCDFISLNGTTLAKLRSMFY
jgi:hypothetical protein